MANCAVFKVRQRAQTSSQEAFGTDAEDFAMPNRAGPQQGVAQKGRLAAGLSKLNSMCADKLRPRFQPGSVDMLRTS